MCEAYGEWFMISEQQFGELKGQVSAIETYVSDISTKFDRVIFGNGQKGLFEVTKANSVQIEELTNKISGLAEKMGSLADGMTALSKTLDAHLSDQTKTFKSMTIDNIKSITFFFTLGFLFLHSIIPADLTVWKLLEKIF